jgi:hypothetical protein
MTDSAYLLELPDVGSIRVMRTNRRDNGRRVFCYVIREGGRVLHRADDLLGPADGANPTAREMAATLVAEIVADATEPILLHTHAETFPAEVRVWAQEHAETLSAAALRAEQDAARDFDHDHRYRPVRPTNGLTMARFPSSAELSHNGHPMPAYITFIRAVNGHRPGTFGKPELLENTPHPEWLTEKYPMARVIHAPEGDRSSGIRIVADAPEAVEAFKLAARELGINILTPA